MNDPKRHPYLLVSASIFAVVAVAHLLRLVNGWTILVDAWQVPMWVSWPGLVLPALLCAWALRLVCR